MVEVVLQTPFDYLAKGLLSKTLLLVGQVVTEREVLGEAQSIDVSFLPDPARAGELPRLGLLGRMAGDGPCIFEPFSRTPGLREVRACVRKQYTLDHLHTRASARQGQEVPPFPRLWVLSAGQPQTVIDSYGLRPMAGWPAGFWAGPPAARLHVVVLRSLPRVRETLLLRLMGRGATLRDAVQDLQALPEGAWELQLALPLLVAFRMDIPQDSLEAEEMDTLQRMEALYADWERQVKSEGARQMLLALLEERFGPLSVETMERLQRASFEDLDQWTRRVLRAQRLEDVLAP